MSVVLNLQNASNSKCLPSKNSIQIWIEAALSDGKPMSERKPEITVRLVDAEEGEQLNQQWRQKPGPTNVLSFPYAEDEYAGDLLGDLVICAPVVESEAKEQGKSLESHWAHMLIHGTLHLLGYDHQQDDEAENMEGLETGILQKLGYANPYEQ